MGLGHAPASAMTTPKPRPNSAGHTQGKSSSPFIPGLDSPCCHGYALSLATTPKWSQSWPRP